MGQHTAKPHAAHWHATSANKKKHQSALASRSHALRLRRLTRNRSTFPLEATFSWARTLDVIHKLFVEAKTVRNLVCPAPRSGPIPWLVSVSVTGARRGSSGSSVYLCMHSMPSTPKRCTKTLGGEPGTACHVSVHHTREYRMSPRENARYELAECYRTRELELCFRPRVLVRRPAREQCILPSGDTRQPVSTRQQRQVLHIPHLITTEKVALLGSGSSGT